MKSLIFIVIFLLWSIAAAQSDTKPSLHGGLGWSFDGRFIAVGTTAGVHIHASDNLEKLLVLDESFDVRTLAWSKTDLRIAFFDFVTDTDRVVIWDLASNDRSEIQTNGPIAHVAWSPSDRYIAIRTYGRPGITIWNTESQSAETEISVSLFSHIGYPLIDWSPNERYIALQAIVNRIAILDASTGRLVDFKWSEQYTSVVRWSLNGHLLGAGGESLRIWKIHDRQHPHDPAVELVGDLVYERTDGGYPNWHPDSSKIAFIDTVYDKEDPSDLSGSHAEIWDLATNNTVELPGSVFVAYVWNKFDAIKWSPDGSKLASISSDGRIVIWDTSSYEIVAEYAGYRPILD